MAARDESICLDLGKDAAFDMSMIYCICATVMYVLCCLRK